MQLPVFLDFLTFPLTLTIIKNVVSPASKRGNGGMKIHPSIRQPRSAFLWTVSALAAFTTLFFSFIHTAEQSHSLLELLAFLVLTAANYRFFSESNKRLSQYSWCFGFFMAFSSFLGLRLNQASGLGGWYGALRVLCASLCASPSAASLLFLTFRYCEKAACLPARSQTINDSGGNNHEKARYWGYTCFLFLCWLPVFLAYYPGLFTYDVYVQIPQVVTGSYDTFHPLLHTFLLGGFYQLGGMLGSYNAGIALYTVIQMLLIALVLAYALIYLLRAGCPRVVRIAALLFFACFPVCPMLAISATKDSLFAPALLLSALFLHQWYTNPSLSKNKPFMLRLVLSIALLCLLRNNAVYAVAVFFVPGLFLVRGRKLRLRFSVFFLASLLLFSVISYGTQKTIQAKTGPVKEALSVPLQQVSRVYNLHQEELDCTEKIEEFIPGAYAYTPYLADSVKAFCNVGIGNLREFLALWANLFFQYPGEYIDAFLWNNIGYWYLDDLSHSQIYGVGLAERQGYLLTDTKQGFGVEHLSLFPPLEQLYELLFSANKYQSIPLLSALFSPSFFTWVFLFLCYISLLSKNRALLLSCALLFGNFFILLFGPCVTIRYVFPLILCCPIFFGLSLTGLQRQYTMAMNNRTVTYTDTL